MVAAVVAALRGDAKLRVLEGLVGNPQRASGSVASEAAGLRDASVQVDHVL